MLSWKLVLHIITEMTGDHPKIFSCILPDLPESETFSFEN